MSFLHQITSWIIDSFSVAASHIAHFFEPSFWLALFQKYQYWIVITGALVEGEMILILAGVAAYYGHMNVYWVVLIAFIGAVLHDNALFFLGRWLGQAFLKKNLKRLKKVEKVMSYILKYDTYFIMGFRFIYGIRTLTPLVIGSSAVKFKRYTTLVTISAFIWATIVVYFGYSSACALETILENFDTYKKYLTIGVGLIVLAMTCFFYWKNRRRSSSSRDKN